MSKFWKLMVLFVAVCAGILFRVFLGDASLDETDFKDDVLWGPDARVYKDSDSEIRPFTVNISDDVLKDLKARLALDFDSKRTPRLVPPLEGTGFEYGTNTNFVKKVVQHWMTKYDWRQKEKFINKYPHFKTTILGLDIHFQVAKSIKKYKTTKPLLLIHGWPGSFVEFQRMIPYLIEPTGSDINFELIIPSIPGYGFSDAPAKSGCGPMEMAMIFHKLMLRLKHEKYYVHGFDWGSIIGTNMATMYNSSVLGLHSPMCYSFHPRAHLRMGAAIALPSLFMDELEIKHFLPITRLVGNALRETGYVHMQSTKPDTIGVALSTSPVGLLAYILEKYCFFTNENWLSKEDGGIVPHYSLDHILDNVMIHWVANSFTSAMRIYAEMLSPSSTQWTLNRVPTSVPVACLNMPHELLAQPKFVLHDKYKNIVKFSYAPTGGHFGGFEVPELVAKDIVDSVSTVM